MTHWQFRKLNPNDTSGTSTAEDNFAQEERTSVDILVRECIQNPLDARRDGETVNVNFKWRSLKTEASELVDDLFTNDFKQQQTAANAGVALEVPALVDFLIIEDFGTIGLCGRFDDSAEDGDGENWNAFWFREGEGVKPTKSNGGAGQGKLTMYVASKIRTVVALTTRSTDGKRLVFGSCRFRRNYVLDRQRYAREARWGSTSNPEQLAMPIADSDTLNRYEEELNIQRGENSGTTFLIPMPAPEITSDAITLAVINEFYFPILRGTLTVNINDCEISSSTIAGLAGKFSDQLRLASSFRIFLEEITAQYLSLEKPLAAFQQHWGNDHKLSPEHLLGGNIDQIRTEFQNGKIISAEFPLRISSVKDGHTSGFLRVFLQESSPNDVNELFVRQDLAVDKEKSLRGAKRLVPARALILIDDEVLSRFLAAAEEPTHREWNGSRPKLALQYRNAAATLRLVRHAASRLLEMLSPPAGKDALALASFFPDVSARQESTKTRQPRKKDATDGGDEGIVTIPLPTQRKLELHPLNDGALVRVNPSEVGTCVFPMTCKLELAYATELGKPFDQWDAADFYITANSHIIKTNDVREIAPKGNQVSFEIDGPNGCFSITGFDNNRQLEMRLKYSEENHADNI